jgi:two-component system, sensor histidine kinase and response regulator
MEKLLIVDDEPNLLSFLMDLLEDDYAVEGAASGAEARERIKSASYHAALLDYQLGDTTGLALAKELLAVDPDMPIILMTAHASLDMAVRAIQGGVYDYLIKPVQAERLRQTLDKALEKRRLAVENKRLLEELKKTNVELSRLNELKSRFLSIVSHDLRTPLTSIKGYAQVLTLQDDLPADQKSGYLKVIAKEADHLGGLINDLMDFVSIEAGKLRVEKKNVPLKEVLDDLAARMRPQAEAKGIKLSVGATEGLPALLLDKRRIEQVLTNLVGNAFKHTPEGGSVSVAAEPGPQGVMVSVQDSGEGIPPADLPRIFEQFFQVEAHQSKKDGIGLGLTICQEIVKAHGGCIEVSSNGPGTGCRFWFTLPK